MWLASTLFPERLDEYLGEDNPVRAIDVFVDELDLAKLGFGGFEPDATGRPPYHPATLTPKRTWWTPHLVGAGKDRRPDGEPERLVIPKMMIGSKRVGCWNGGGVRDTMPGGIGLLFATMETVTAVLSS